MSAADAGKLLSCPFCGKPPMVRGQGTTAQCDSCTFSMDVSTWNTRAALQPQGGQEMPHSERRMDAEIKARAKAKP